MIGRYIWSGVGTGIEGKSATTINSSGCILIIHRYNSSRVEGNIIRKLEESQLEFSAIYKEISLATRISFFAFGDFLVIV
jgi:hypothetical protein